MAGATSAAVPAALDNEDILGEKLLLLPMRPSSLPRAGAVCMRWRRLVTDPGFLRRFRAHNRTAPCLASSPTCYIVIQILVGDCWNLGLAH